MSKENTIIFEQPLLQLRVVHTTDGAYDIEVAMYEGKSIGTVVEDEVQAKAITNGLMTAYIAGLNDLQDRMLEALSKIEDEHTEGRKSVGV